MVKVSRADLIHDTMVHFARLVKLNVMLSHIYGLHTTASTGN